MIGGRSNLLEQHLHKKRVDPPQDLFEQQQQQQQQQPSLCFIGLQDQYGLRDVMRKRSAILFLHLSRILIHGLVQ